MEAWRGQEGAAGDDSQFWLGEDRGFVRGSKESLRVKWLAASSLDAALYLIEGDDFVNVSQRFAVGVMLDKEGVGFRLPAKERARLLQKLEVFKAGKETALLEEDRRGVEIVGEVKDECALCGEGHPEEEDEQVMCDTCSLGFHLDCLMEAGIYFPDDVLEDGVEWGCKSCSSDMEEVAVLFMRRKG
jgi:hypothetical protein